MENYIPSKWEAKESWSSNAHTDKIDLKIKKITRGKEEHYIMIQEDITSVNTLNGGAPRYIRQTLTDIKGEIDSNTIIGDFNTPLTPLDRSSK